MSKRVVLTVSGVIAADIRGQIESGQRLLEACANNGS